MWETKPCPWNTTSSFFLTKLTTGRNAATVTLYIRLNVGLRVTLPSSATQAPIEKVEAQKLLNAAEYKSNKIDVFMKKILGNFPTSEAAVERGFSKHKAIHGKFRANLEESLVEKILFVRENKMFNTPDEKPTDEVDEMLDFDDCEL